MTNQPIPEEAAHSLLSPSAAHRWVVCTGSVPAIEANKHLLPPDNTTYADEGSLAHALAAAILTGNAPEAQRLTEQADLDMQTHVRDYVLFCRRDAVPGEIEWIETKVSLFYRSSDRGTVDYCRWGKGRIVVRDLKYGAGVSVEAVGNKQLAIYALSLIDSLALIEDVPDSMPVILEIFQPRDRSNSEPIRSWELTAGELRTFCEPIRRASEDIAAGRTSLVADEKACRFCPMKRLGCLTYMNQGLEPLPIEEPKLENLALGPSAFPPTMAITREQRIRILRVAPLLEEMFSELRAQEIFELEQGAASQGFKLVTGKSNRKWADEAAAEKLLRNYLPAEAVRPPGDVISVAAAEKLLKPLETSTKFDNKLKALIVKPEGKPTLVSDSDPRPALCFNPTDGLEKLPETPSTEEVV